MAGEHLFDGVGDELVSEVLQMLRVGIGRARRPNPAVGQIDDGQRCDAGRTSLIRFYIFQILSEVVAMGILCS